jgi:DNA mismatch repair protein MutS
MHRVKPGPANQSYGLQVAKLAGIPKAAILLAKRKLHLLEQQSSQSGPQIDLFTEADETEPEPHPALQQLESITLDDLTPKQALDALYQLKTLLDQD